LEEYFSETDDSNNMVNLETSRATALNCIQRGGLG